VLDALVVDRHDVDVQRRRSRDVDLAGFSATAPIPAAVSVVPVDMVGLGESAQLVALSYRSAAQSPVGVMRTLLCGREEV